MVDQPIYNQKTFQCKSGKRQTTISVLKKVKRNKNRKSRRKRSKVRYRSQLRTTRFSRINNSYENITVYDMECKGAFDESLTDVTEWQFQHQIAYWKSRAVSLEYENKMLHKHIRDMYVRQINDYVASKQYLEECDNDTEEQDAEDQQSFDKIKAKTKKIENEILKPPTEDSEKVRQDRMKQLYGSMAPKIIGMETAVQLNYDYNIDKCKPAYWPNLPLKM